MICLVGTVYLFYIVPKAFLPVGDSSFIRGVMVAQEGSSPDQMRAYQEQVEKVLHANPAVDMTFTMTGNQLSPRQPGIRAGVPEGPVAARRRSRRWPAS